jgi:hypothetical protein
MIVTTSTSTTTAEDDQSFIQNQHTNIQFQETTVQFSDTETTSTSVINTLSVSLENNTEKEYETNGPKSADQSEISENQYFSANETTQVQSSSSSSSSTSAISATSSSTSSPSSYATNDEKNDDSLIKCQDKTLNNNNETIILENNFSEASTMAINQEESEDLIMGSNLDFIESEGDYPRIESDNDAGKGNENSYKNDDDDEEKKEEILTMESINNNNNNQVDDSTDSTESSKTITSNISDIEIESNGTSKSSEYSDLENLKIRTIDIESDENLCDISGKSNDEKRDEEVDSEPESNDGDENEVVQTVDVVEEAETEIVVVEENKVDIFDEQLQDVVDEEHAVEDLVENKNELFLDEELREIVEKIVLEVIENAVFIVSQSEELKNESVQSAETLPQVEVVTKVETVPEVETLPEVETVVEGESTVVTEKILLNIENTEDNEIINTKIQEIESLTAHYNDENDFNLYQNSEYQKQQLGEVVEEEEEEEQILEKVADEDFIVIDSAIVTLSKNLENEMTVEFNNKSFQDEIQQNENEKEDIQIIDLNDALEEIKAGENVSSSKVDSVEIAQSLEKSTTDKKPKSGKKVTTSDVDCFGCSIL